MNIKNFRILLLSGAAPLALLIAIPQHAGAQSYSTGPGVYVSLEGRYLWNKGDKAKNYALSEDPAPSADFTPYKTSRSAADKGWGGKAMLGYRFTNNWDIGIGVAGGWLKGKDDTHSYNYGRTGVELALAPNALSDHITTKLQYTTADFEAGYSMPMGGSSSLRLFGGVRFAHLDQTAKATVEHASFDLAYYNYSGRRKTTFTGIGPRLGLDGTVGIGNSGFNIFGGLSGALLLGRYNDKHDFNFVGTNGVNRAFAYRDEKKTKIVPNVEGELGLGYNFRTGSGGSTVGLQLGYRGEAFFGAGTKGFTSAIVAEKANGDYLMHGPFVRLVATFGSAAPAPMAAPLPPPPAPMAVKSFIVFFDFDKSNITAEAQKTIADAVAAAKAGGSTRVTLTGHTDRSGSEQYNMALSLRRAEAVKASMIQQGVPASTIMVIGRGETQPLINTPDGVREPQNRRVEIVI